MEAEVRMFMWADYLQRRAVDPRKTLLSGTAAPGRRLGRESMVSSLLSRSVGPISMPTGCLRPRAVCRQTISPGGTDQTGLRLAMEQTDPCWRLRWLDQTYSPAAHFSMQQDRRRTGLHDGMDLAGSRFPLPAAGIE